MRNRDHVNILRAGTAVWNNWRAQVPSVVPEVEGAEVEEINLEGADFSSINLQGIYFRNCILRKANFQGSSLVETGFHDTDLSRAMFACSTMGDTSFVNVDLTMAIGLESVVHTSTSEIRINSIENSGGQIPEVFLRATGQPEEVIMYALELRNALAQNRYHSCFISYSRKDLMFAQMLQERLESRGIRCWRDHHELLPGQDIEAGLRAGVENWDKLLLCCSEASLTSLWVDREISYAFQKERAPNRTMNSRSTVVLPVDLDGYMLSAKWKSEHRAEILKRLAADFTSTEKNWRKFNFECEKLIRAVAIGDQSSLAGTGGQGPTTRFHTRPTSR
jgi:TIR domain/Pentapeptide repeats (8 copies)